MTPTKTGIALTAPEFYALRSLMDSIEKEVQACEQKTEGKVEPPKSGCYQSLDMYPEPQEPPMKKSDRYFNKVPSTFTLPGCSEGTTVLF